jgi:hypothetical protein
MSSFLHRISGTDGAARAPQPLSAPLGRRGQGEVGPLCLTPSHLTPTLSARGGEGA